MRASSLILLLVVGFFQAAQAAGDPYTAWAIKHFGSATAPEAAPSADPDGDGLDNLLEYALGTDPLVPSLPPTPMLVPVSWLTGDQSAYIISATIRTDDPDLVVFPQVSEDNAFWLPFALDQLDVSLGESLYTVKVEETVPYRGVKQITWAALPTGTGIDPHFLRLTAIRQSAVNSSTSRQSATPAAARVTRAFSAQSSTASIPGLVFTGQLYASVGSDLVSNTVVLRGLNGTITVTAPADVNLIVNGIDRGQSWKVKNGDTLALRAKAPLTPNQQIARTIQFAKGPAVTWQFGSKKAGALGAPAGTVSGYTPVSASVGAGGDANISLPITVSPGIGGMEPKLSIGYSSQGGNGLLGVGFNLGGLSAISRVGRTVVQDGVRGSVKLDANDRFVVDGARIISIAGNDGADGTTYEKELTDFSRIISHGQSVSSPASWTVETKAGLKFTYGGTADSQVRLPGRQEVLTWLVSSVEDTVGNQIWFTYENDGAANSASTRIARIDYTCRGGIGNNPAQNHVDFTYEIRPDAKPGYMLGSKIISPKRLASIDAKHGNQVVRRYEFAYQQSELSGQSQLVQVIEKGHDGSAFAPTVFTWNQNSATNMTLQSASQTPGLSSMGFSKSPPGLIVQGDFKGDGHMGLMGFDDHIADTWLSVGKNDGSFDFAFVASNFSSTSAIDPTTARIRTGDFNADGKTDVLHISKSGGNNWLAQSKGDGTFTILKGQAQLGDIYNIGQSGDYNTEIMAMDLNGDGFTDLVYLESHGNNHIYLNNGNGSFTEKTLGPNDPFRSFKISNNSSRYTWVLPGDYNGDGLADLLLMYYQGQHQLALSNGDGTFTVRQTGELGGLAGQKFAASYSYMIAADVNGDGLTDIVNFKDKNNKEVFVSICRGDGTFEPTIFSNPLNALPISGPQYTHVYSGDFNGDGVADILSTYNSSSNLNGLAFGLAQSDFTSFVGSTAGAISQISTTDPEHNPESRIFVGDFDGDGSDDVLVLNYNTGNSSLVRSTGFDRNRVEQVTNGHGGYSRFVYTPMTNPSVYEKGSGAAYPAMDFVAPVQVVSQMFTRNGVDGDPDSPNAGAAPGETVLHYNYNWSIAYTNGRGLQQPTVGVEYNETTGILMTTFHVAGDPLLSSFPQHTDTWLPNGTRVNETTTQWIRQPRSNTENHKTYFAFATSSIKTDYEVKAELAGNPRQVVKITSTAIDAATGYDGHGNLLASTETVTDRTNTYSTSTANTYKDSDATPYILGRLSKSKVTKTVPGSTTPSVRTSAFDYESSSGLLKTETVEPDGDIKLRIVKTYQHDQYGNITESAEQAWNGVGAPALNATRTKHTDYSDDGRFIMSTRNTLGHVELTEHEPLLGQVFHQTGPNKIETSWEFDAFGRPIHEMRADGSETRSAYLRATPGQGGAPARAVHCVVSQSSATPAQTIWYDVLDREIQRDAIGFDGSPIFVRKIFNSHGQVSASSNPTFSGQNPSYATMEYDAIGREIKRTLPGNFVSTVSYNGLTTVATNSEGQKHTRTATLLDKLESALDHFGKPLTYTHDAAGNLAGVTDSSGNATALTFDNRGNKISLTEPNTGKTTYEYNGFGELIAQTTSDKQRTTFEYDTLGRLVKRVEPGETCQWFYDNYKNPADQFAAHSLGKLISVQKTSFREDHRYDSFGRPVETITRIGLENFSTTTSYDYVGRVDTVTYPTAFAIRNIYNSFGHLAEVQNAASSASFWKATKVNARGQVEAESLGNGLVTQRTFDPNNGLLRTIQTGAAGGTLHEVQNLAYSHNSIGTFVERQDIARGVTETFGYDEVNRLKQVSITGATAEFPTVDVQYDDLGNPTSRTDAGTYTYSPASGPHAVTGLTGRPGGAPDLRYSYDARGNRIKTERLAGNKWTTDLNIKFNIANLPTEIASPAVAKGPGFPEARKSSGSTFSYTPDRARYRQVQKVNGKITVDRFYIGSLYEREKRGHTVRHIHYIPAGTGVVAIQQSEEGPTTIGGERTLYVHKDHLGSVESLTNQNGGLVEHLSFDAWGRRRDVAFSGGAYAVSYPAPNPFPAKNVSRGFTGHEMLDAFGIVHMNGRLYDPLTDRFLSADPIVQELDNLQNLNRYSYVLNNPLTMTDPSGFSFIGKYWKQIVAVAVAVVLAVVAPYIAGYALASFWGAVIGGAAGGFGGAFTGTLLAGGSIGDAFRAGVIGGAIGAATAGAIHGASTAVGLHGLEGSFEGGTVLNRAGEKVAITGTTFAEKVAEKVAIHGVIGGISSELQGGKFTHGFLAGGATGFASPFIAGAHLSGAGQVAAAAVVGGTASQLGGGKFGNGAVTGAFVYLFNEGITTITEGDGKVYLRNGTTVLPHTDRNQYNECPLLEPEHDDIRDVYTDPGTGDVFTKRPSWLAVEHVNSDHLYERVDPRNPLGSFECEYDANHFYTEEGGGGTYNYCRSTNRYCHYEFDYAPHKESPHYTPALTRLHW